MTNSLCSARDGNAARENGGALLRGADDSPIARDSNGDMESQPETIRGSPRGAKAQMVGKIAR